MRNNSALTDRLRRKNIVVRLWRRLIRGRLERRRRISTNLSHGLKPYDLDAAVPGGAHEPTGDRLEERIREISDELEIPVEALRAALIGAHEPRVVIRTIEDWRPGEFSPPFA